MKRREFICGLGGAAVWPVVGRAQQPERMRRIGVLMSGAENDPQGQLGLAAFARRLQDLGWIAGRNCHIDYRWAAGDRERMQLFARELVALQPEVIFARTTPVVAALFRETRTIPIVFAVVSDPVGDGFVASLARPGGNLTGFTNVESSLGGKWLELLKDTAPRIERVALMFNPKTAPGGGLFYSRLVEAAASSVAITPTAIPVGDAAEVEHGIDEFARAPNGGLLVLPDATTNLHRKLIIALAAKYRLPAIYSFSYMAAEGGLISYGIDSADINRQAATYVNRILNGERPGDLPVKRRLNSSWSSTARPRKLSALKFHPNSCSPPTR